MRGLCAPTIILTSKPFWSIAFANALVTGCAGGLAPLRGSGK